MLPRLAALLLVPLLASCQPPEHAARAVFFGNALAFVAADPGESDAAGCWKGGVVVDDTLSPAWRFSGPGTGECRRLFPLFYGRAPEGTETTVPPKRLQTGRLYLLIGDATGEVPAAFALTQAGSARIVHDVDPASPAAAALREAWWRQPAAPAPAARR